MKRQALLALLTLFLIVLSGGPAWAIKDRIYLQRPNRTAWIGANLRAYTCGTACGTCRTGGDAATSEGNGVYYWQDIDTAGCYDLYADGKLVLDGVFIGAGRATAFFDSSTVNGLLTVRSIAVTETLTVGVGFFDDLRAGNLAVTRSFDQPSTHGVFCYPWWDIGDSIAGVIGERFRFVCVSRSYTPTPPVGSDRPIVVTGPAIVYCNPNDINHDTLEVEESWFLHSGTPATKANRIPLSGYAGAYWMDVSSGGWQDRIVGDCVDELAGDFSDVDGIYLDGPGSPEDYVANYGVGSALENATVVYTEAEFETYCLDIISAVKAAIGRKLLILNAALYPSFMAASDGSIMEEFVHASWRTNTDLMTEAQWKASVDSIGNRDFDGKYVLAYSATSETTDSAMVEYCYASYLLGYNPHARSYFYWAGGPDWFSDLFWYPLYAMDIGEPFGSYYKSTDGTYRRDFTNGLVVVNPSDPAEGMIAQLGNAYVNSDGDTVRSAELARKSGAVFRSIAGLWPIASATDCAGNIFGNYNLSGPDSITIASDRKMSNGSYIFDVAGPNGSTKAIVTSNGAGGSDTYCAMFTSAILPNTKYALSCWVRPKGDTLKDNGHIVIHVGTSKGEWGSLTGIDDSGQIDLYAKSLTDWTPINRYVDSRMIASVSDTETYISLSFKSNYFLDTLMVCGFSCVALDQGDDGLNTVPISRKLTTGPLATLQLPHGAAFPASPDSGWVFVKTSAGYDSLCWYDKSGAQWRTVTPKTLGVRGLTADSVTVATLLTAPNISVAGNVGIRGLAADSATIKVITCVDKLTTDTLVYNMESSGTIASRGLVADSLVLATVGTAPKFRVSDSLAVTRVRSTNTISGRGFVADSLSLATVLTSTKGRIPDSLAVGTIRGTATTSSRGLVADSLTLATVGTAPKLRVSDSLAVARVRSTNTVSARGVVADTMNAIKATFTGSVGMRGVAVDTITVAHKFLALNIAALGTIGARGVVADSLRASTYMSSPKTVLTTYLTIPRLTTDPSPPAAGQMWINTTSGELKFATAATADSIKVVCHQ